MEVWNDSISESGLSFVDVGNSEEPASRRTRNLILPSPQYYYCSENVLSPPALKSISLLTQNFGGSI